MTYGIYIYYKIRKGGIFFFIQNLDFCLGGLEMSVGVLGVFCTMNCYFEYRIRILCI